MSVNKISDEELLGAMEKNLADQIPEAPAPKSRKKSSIVEKDQNPEIHEKTVADMVGSQIDHIPGQMSRDAKKEFSKTIDKLNSTKVGGNIFENAEYQDGWIDVPRTLLGERDIFYPSTWHFKIRPASVEAIRNWSTLDENSLNSIDIVFNEILKSCLSISTPNGPMPWGNINSWDRFFFILLIREYTFIHGESKIEYKDYCPNCENEATFNLTSSALMFDMPDTDVMSMYNQETCSWYIDPSEYGLNNDAVTLYLPTVDKDIAIKTWIINKVQANKNYKPDPVFIKFLPWIAPKISKDETIAQRQINEYKRIFNSWDIDMFSFMDSVLKNIVVTPSTKLITKCDVCGEEVTSEIRFPNSISSLFTVQNKFKKFGSK